MSARHQPVEAVPVDFGFSVGVLRLVWDGSPPESIPHRPGKLYKASLTLHAAPGTLQNDDIIAALANAIVRKNGTLCRIAGVEPSGTIVEDSCIGLLLVPITVEEKWP
jgi:hypothetical protein